MGLGTKAPGESPPDGFKSEGERQIGRLLDRCGLSYRYEYPMAVIDRGKLRIWYPDFLLPEYGMVIECVGMRGGNSYNDRLEHKKKLYTGLKLPVVFLGPEDLRGCWPRRVMEGIEKILEGRLDSFRRRAEEWVDY